MDQTDKLTSRLTQIIETQSQLSSAAFDLDQFLDIVVQRMMELTPATGAVIELLEDDEMVYTAAGGSISGFVGTRLKRKGTLSGLCLTDQELKISYDTSCDDRVDTEACKRVGANSMVCVPLFRMGEAVGVLKVVSTEINAFSDDDVQTLRLMAGMLGGALGQQLEVERRLHLEERLRHVAHHDQLTGLPNRELLYDRLNQAINRTVREKSMLAVFYLDLDKFKPVNDKYGHHAGDTLLKAFAKRISKLIRATDTFARIGGDEFVVVAEGIKKAADAELLAQKIITAASEAFVFDGLDLHIGTSVGIAISEAASINPNFLVALADAALYTAKNAGRNQYCVSDVFTSGYSGY